MNYLKYAFSLSLFFLINACQKNVDTDLTETVIPRSVEVVETELYGEVSRLPTYLWSNTPIQNVTVQILYNGAILDETNTDIGGNFFFASQPIPVEGVVIQVEAIDHYPNIKKIYPTSSNAGAIFIMPLDYGDFSGEAATTEGDKIKITGNLVKQSMTDIPDAIMYITNNNNQIIGSYYTNPDELYFEITATAEEDLFLYYETSCDLSDPIAIGTFSQDTNIGDIIFDDSSLDNWITISGQALHCDGSPVSGYVNARYNEATSFMASGLTQDGAFLLNIQECQVKNQEILVNVIDYDYATFGEVSITYTPGQDMNTDISNCSSNDTYFKYQIGSGDEVADDSYSYANILSNGKAIIRVDRYWVKDIALKIGGSNPGAYIGNLLFFDITGIPVAGENLNYEITFNDGEYMEGTFSGEAKDFNESSLGSLTGSFRARIQ